MKCVCGGGGGGAERTHFVSGIWVFCCCFWVNLWAAQGLLLALNTWWAQGMLAGGGVIESGLHAWDKCPTHCTISLASGIWVLSLDLLIAITSMQSQRPDFKHFPERTVWRILVSVFSWRLCYPAQSEIFPDVVTLGSGLWNLPCFQNRWPLTRRFTYLVPPGPINQPSKVLTCNKQAIHSSRN